MKKNKKKLIIIGIIILIISLIIFSIIKKSGGNKKVLSTTVQSKNLQEKIYLSGNLDAKSKAKVTFIGDSRITWIGVKEGTQVKKYQSLAKQDTSEIEKSLKTSLNDFLVSRDSFDQTISNNNLGDQSDPKIIAEMKRIINKSQLSLNNSVIDVELKDMAIKKSYLSSPIKGIVTKSPSSQVGSYPNANDFFEIVDPATEYISAMVGQQDVIKLKVGQKAKITLDSYRDLPFEATVDYVSYSPVDTTNNKYEVKLTYTRDPEKYNYHLGMTGEIEVLLSEKNNTLVLPRQYISSDKGKRYVTLINNKASEKREILTGMENYEEIEILSGLNIGDTVSYTK